MIGFALFFISVLSLGCYGMISFYTSAFLKRRMTWKIRLVQACAAVTLGVLGYFIRTLALGLLHLAILLGLCKLVYIIARRVIKARPRNRIFLTFRWIYKSGIVPIVLIIIAFIIGYCNMNTVVGTSYSVSSDKLNRNYRVIFLSDLHYGTVQDESVLAEKVSEIDAKNPDVILLGGDLFDEGASKEKMEECFAILGKLKNQYGIYYVYGNHDRQRYSSAPTYTEDELKNAIEKNGITILRESFVNINDDLVLYGREDLSVKDERLSAETILSQIDTNRFVLTIDHQANDTDSNVAIGTDLQLSGHSHGGQIFPLAWFPFLYRGYVYGDYLNKDMHVFVSSGFAGWGFPIRTQGVSEYVVVDLLAQ